MVGQTRKCSGFSALIIELTCFFTNRSTKMLALDGAATRASLTMGVARWVRVVSSRSWEGGSGGALYAKGARFDT